LYGIVHDLQCGVPGNGGKSQEKAQGYSGFGLKLQTRTPKSAQLASRAPVRAAKDHFRLGRLAIA
jgi:hypothetical protein